MAVRSNTSQHRLRIQKKVWEYEKRIKEIKEQKYPPLSLDPFIEDPRSALACAKLQAKINEWNQKINEIDKIKVKIVAIANAVATFTGYNVRPLSVEGKTRTGKIHEKKSQLAQLGRHLFYKYGLENGIPGVALSDYIFDKAPKSAFNCRRNFTRSLSTNKENKELWERFKIHVEKQTSGNSGEY